MSDKEMTLGEYLRGERERRGITIEQVASATKVGVRTLHALEGDQFSELPAKPYIRGFVTSYCRFIGLDPKEIRARFEDFVNQKASERPNREGGHSGYAFDRKDNEQQSRTFLLIGIISFVVVGGVAILILKPTLKHHRNSHIEKLQAAHPETLVAQPALGVAMGPTSLPKAEVHGAGVTVSTTPQPVMGPSSIPSLQGREEKKAVTVVPQPQEEKKVATVVPQPQVSPSPMIKAGVHDADDPLDSGLKLSSGEIHHKLVVRTLEDIWVRYQVDHRVLRKFIIRKGNSLVLRAKDRIQFQASRPQAITYSYNGKPYQTLESSKNLIRVSGTPTLLFPVGESSQLSPEFAYEVSLPTVIGPSPQREGSKKIHKE